MEAIERRGDAQGLLVEMKWVAFHPVKSMEQHFVSSKNNASLL